MKKILTSILLSLFTASAVLCVETKETIILQPTDTALLFFNERPLELEVSNPEIIKAQTISDIFEEDSKITVNAIELGTVNLIVKTKNNNYKYLIRVQETAPKDNSLLLDTID